MPSRSTQEAIVYTDSNQDGGYVHMGDYPVHGGPVTVVFRLVSMDGSTTHDSASTNHPITPLNTPYTQSPATSPNMRADGCNYGPAIVPAMVNQGVYYGAPVGQFYQDQGELAHFAKPRALSAEIHHSPHFQYQLPSHRASFSVQTEKDGVGPFVSAEMLLSAMPERYDD